MTRLVLYIYDKLHRNRLLYFALLAAIVVCSALLTLRLHFSEDISDFLPNNKSYWRSMSIYQQINAANRIFVVFQLRDTSQSNPEKLIPAVEQFSEAATHERWKTTAKIDYNKLMNVVSFVYRNAPLFLTDSDYKRMEQQLSPDSISSTLQHSQEQLFFPFGGFTSDNIQRDPLGLFTPLISRLRRGNSSLR